MSSSSYIGGVGSGVPRDYGDYFILPAAPAQRSLWFVCQLNPASNAAYNISSAVRLTGDLDVVLLQQAVHEVVARHESLRTGVGLVDGEPHQLVLPEALLPLPVVDCTDLPAADARERVQALAREQATLPFALDAPPLLRLVLVKEAPRCHTLIITIHHLVSDGWSMDVFSRDLAEAYGAPRENGEAGLADLPVQYADYISWFHDRLSGERMDLLLAHWKKALGGTEPLELPVDRPRELNRGGDGGRLEERLDGSLTAEVDRLAKQVGGTPFMVLLTCFMVVLARVTGQEDVAVGTPVAGRHHPDAERLIGFFANTLVLRARLRPGESFASAAASVKNSCLGAFSHDEMPFDRLVQEMRQARSLHRNPLFDVMFSMSNTPTDATELPGLTMTPVELTTTAAKFDLWLTVLPDGDGLRVRLEYDKALYDRRTAARLLELYRLVLAEALRAPDTPVEALPSSAAGDGRTDRSPSVSPAGGRTVPELLDERGADDVVLSSADAVLTLGELREWASALTRRLSAEGIIGPGARITTPPVPSGGLVAVILAVLQVGGVLAYGRRHDLTGAFVRKAEEEPDGWLITTGPRFDPAPGTPAPGPDLPAWRASGMPANDGATVSHGALADGLTALANRLAVTAEDDVILLGDGGPPSPVNLLMPLVHARSLMISGTGPAPGGPPGALVLASPPTWRRSLAEGWTPPPAARLVCVGEVLPPDLIEMLARTGRQVFLGRPGPAPLATPLALSPLDNCLGGRLGPPLPGTQRLLLDVHGRPVPAGVVGELHMTDAAHGPVPTGLLGRLAGDGEPVVVGPAAGRLFVGDRAVVTSAVERVLRGIEGVREAVVTSDTHGQLIGWLVPEGSVPMGSEREREAFAAEVRGRARAALPRHEVPAVLGVLAELPTADDGTVDRTALPQPPEQPQRDVEEDIQPGNDVERRVLELFRDLLGLPRVGMHADFFGLGGHSLLAAKLLSRVRDEFGLQIPVRDFFRAPTPTGLVAAVQEQQTTHDRETGDGGGTLAELAGMSDDEIDQLLRHLN
ncbi:non-ribosomal peptide synthetase/polyketide synthase [Streptomyces alkaliphilus]|uniref:Non-ribosomal peptide synthetase/polyketide synthase n=1 Tax=Streptomyces alkaliphilus TaxID=1472722 RepID=A0A7W3T956_9ACTN|nr:condensation domain-containing protein [Streptomyces alkaliphilus]MBB0242564.1 non-ribosomal peptide synthetase/polyketide synthase [Streptomyces alkaliphilus]